VRRPPSSALVPYTTLFRSCAEHGGVVAQQHGGRYGDRGGGEGADDGVLAAHVVRGGQYMAQWWTADHPAVGAVVDDVGEVRPTSFDHPAAQGTGEQPRPFPLEVGAQPVQIEARRVLTHETSSSRWTRLHTDRSVWGPGGGMSRVH